MKKYRTILFDLDGTLLDTIEDLTSSVNHVMRTFGEPEHSREAVRKMVGNGVRKLMERAIPDGTACPSFEEQVALQKEYYLSHSREATKPFDGIIPLLQECRNRGIMTGVVSNKDHPAVRELCYFFFKDLITESVGNGEGRRVKPYPDGCYEAMMRLMADKASTLYVGDSEVDAQTAENAGLDCVLVSWGFREKEQLLKEKAVAVIDEPAELLDFVSERKIFSQLLYTNHI